MPVVATAHPVVDTRGATATEPDADVTYHPTGTRPVYRPISLILDTMVIPVEYAGLRALDHLQADGL
jgi:hypothetical protein